LTYNRHTWSNSCQNVDNQTLIDKNEEYFNACVHIYQRAKASPNDGSGFRSRLNRVIDGGAVFKTENHS